MKRRTGILDPAPPTSGPTPGPPSGSGDDGSGGWSWLVTAADRFEAEVVRGLLETAGVPVVLDGFDRSPSAWMYPSGNVNAPVRVLVPTGLLDVARLELLESSVVHESRLAETIRPQKPQRGTQRVNRLVWAVVAVLTALAVAWIIVVEVAGFAPCAAHMFCIN